MTGIVPHSWPSVPAEAIAMQKELCALVSTVDDLPTVNTVAGLDVGPLTSTGMIRGAIAVMSFPDLRMADQAVAYRVPTLPYVPGLLSFREIPALLAALEKLGVLPDLLLCDGQGLAHPRRFGIASHLGVLTGIPTIGVAKSLLVGEHTPVPDKRGAWRPLMHKGDIVGAALRTRTGCAPIYVSIGHRVSLDTAIRYTLACTTRFRLPETTRAAHRLASGP